MVVRLTKHAVARYRERVKPALDAAQAHEDLGRCLEFATIEPGLPGWVWRPPEGWDVQLDPELRRTPDVVAMVGPDIAVPLEARGGDVMVAVTVLTRAGLPDGARRHVNRRNAARRRARQQKRRKLVEKRAGRDAKRAGKDRAAARD